VFTKRVSPPAINDQLCLQHLSAWLRTKNTWWSVKQVEKCRAWWLLLVRNIRMPSHRVDSLFKVVFRCRFFSASMNQMNLWMSLWRPTGGMDMMSSKIPTKLKSFGDGQVCKVLVSECCDRNQSSFIQRNLNQRINNIPTTFFCATNKANSSFPLSVNLLI
jgi:hypothetical protein